MESAKLVCTLSPPFAGRGWRAPKALKTRVDALKARATLSPLARGEGVHQVRGLILLQAQTNMR
jgi:hypothetical protein